MRYHDGDGREPEDEPAWSWIETYEDLQDWRFYNPDRRPANCLYIGISDDLVMAQPNTNLLVLGPAQGGGKTSGNVVPQILCARGPVVATTSKGDLIAPVVMACALRGQVWHFGPDEEPTPLGMKELRWSPVPMCTSWDTAMVTASAMTKAAKDPNETRSDNGGFFTDQAVLAIACLLQYAAHFGHGMDFVSSIATNPRQGGFQKGSGFGVLNILAQLRERRLWQAYEALEGLNNAPEKQRQSVWSTASQALRVYLFEGVRRATTDPNFDIDAFCAGTGTDEYDQHFDTVFITAAEQDDAAPVITTFLAQLRIRRRRLFRRDNDPDGNGDPHRPPLTFVLDELATMAPIHDLPRHLAIGNEGLLTVGVLQDYSQAKKLWGTEQGRGILTLFQNVIVFRGIRDTELLRSISDLAGQRWIEVTGWNEGSSSSGWFQPMNNSAGMSVSQHQVPDLPMDVIAQGHPSEPDAVLWLCPDGGYQWVHNAPYYRSLPWAPVLVSTMEQIAQLPASDPRRLLRVPRLFEGYTGGPYGLAVWESRYWKTRRVLDDGRRNKRNGGRH